MKLQRLQSTGCLIRNVLRWGVGLGLLSNFSFSRLCLVFYELRRKRVKVSAAINLLIFQLVTIFKNCNKKNVKTCDLVGRLNKAVKMLKSRRNLVFVCPFWNYSWISVFLFLGFASDSDCFRSQAEWGQRNRLSCGGTVISNESLSSMSSVRAADAPAYEATCGMT